MGRQKSMVPKAECSGTDTAMKRGGSLLLPRLLGSGLAGVCELSVFHPVDTVAKRLMTSKQQFQLAKANEILFRGQTGSLGARIGSLSRGWVSLVCTRSLSGPTSSVSSLCYMRLSTHLRSGVRFRVRR